MKRVAALVLAGAALAARAAVTNVVDVDALIAAVDAGLSETNGWTMSGLGKYAKGADYVSNPACVKFDTKGDWLLSPDFGAPIIRLVATNRCSSTSPSRWLHVLDGKSGLDLGCFTACLEKNRADIQEFAIDTSLSVSCIKLQLDGSGTTGVWGIGSLKVLTAEPAVEPAGLHVSRMGDDWCALSWVNGAGTVSNRVDAYQVERGKGEDVLLSTGFDGFDATDKGNPVPSSGSLPGIDSALSGVNVYAPPYTSGICQVGKGDALGIIRWSGVEDYDGVRLRMTARRYPGDNAETMVAYELAGATNVVREISLPDEFGDCEVSLANVPGGASILVGYYTKKSNRRVLIDSLSIVRTGVDALRPLGSSWLPAPPGPVSFSTKGAFALPERAECRFDVFARNVDGLVSDASTVETRIGGVPGFRFILR